MYLNVVDVSSPSSLISIEALPVDGSSNDRMGLDYSNNFVYVALGSGGVQAFSPLTIIAEEGSAASFETPVVAGTDFRLDADSQAAGMLIDADTGAVTWADPDHKEDGTGLHELTITYTDAQQNDQSLKYYVWVENINDPPTITSETAMLAWKYGVVNNYQVQIVDPDISVKGYDETFSFSVDTASIDKGVSINGQGILSWNPTEDQVGTYSIGVTVVDKAGETASHSFSVKVFNFNQKMTQVGRSSSDIISNVRDVKVQGDYAYVVGDNRLYIFKADDLWDHVGYLDDLWNARSIDVLGNFAYVASDNHGLYIIDISDPNSPINAYDVGGHGYETEEQSSYHNVTIGAKDSKIYAYLVGGKNDGVNFFEVVDVSSPGSPVHRDEATTSNVDWPRSVKVSGDYAYVAYGCDGLKIYNVSNPSSISLAGELEGIGCTRDIVLDATYAYLATDWDGMKVVKEIFS